MSNRQITALIPAMQPLVTSWLDDCHRAGLDIIVTCTHRTIAEQAALYAQGRGGLDAVNALRHVAAMTPITEAENAHCRTNARLSLHTSGWAVDFAVMDGGKYAPDVSPLWDIAGELAEKHGLEWAGRWKSFGEKCHVQLSQLASW